MNSSRKAPKLKDNDAFGRRLCFGPGVKYVVMFVLLANASAVVTGRFIQTQQLHPFTLLFWATTITTLAFWLERVLIDGLQAMAVRRHDIPALIALNLMSAISWTGYFIALADLEPAVATAIMCGLGPVCTILLDRIVRQCRFTRDACMTGTGILCGTTLLIFSSVAGFSGVAAPVSSAVLSGVIAAVIGGVAQSLTVIAIKQLGDYGWKPRKILAHRFYLLAISTAIAARFGPGLSVHIQDQIVPLSITTLFGIVLPLWSLQKGVLLSDPFTVSALIATGPVLTYVLQGFDNRINWSITSAAGCILVALFTLYASMNKAGKIK